MRIDVEATHRGLPGIQLLLHYFEWDPSPIRGVFGQTVIFGVVTPVAHHIPVASPRRRRTILAPLHPACDFCDTPLVHRDGRPFEWDDQLLNGRRTDGLLYCDQCWAKEHSGRFSRLADYAD